MAYSRAPAAYQQAGGVRQAQQQAGGAMSGYSHSSTPGAARQPMQAGGYAPQQNHAGGITRPNSQPMYGGAASLPAQGGYVQQGQSAYAQQQPQSPYVQQAQGGYIQQGGYAQQPQSPHIQQGGYVQQQGGYVQQGGRAIQQGGYGVAQPVAQNMSSTGRLGGQANLAQISDLLNNRTILKEHVVKCFRKVTTDSEIDLRGLMQVQQLLSQAMGTPPSIFGDLQTEFECFDFDGTGRLDVNELYKMTKFNLRQYRKKMGGESKLNVPVTSPQGAGYRVGKKLGEGSQGTVVLATNRQGREVCIKQLPKAQMGASGIEELQDEFETLQLLACSRIASAAEMFQDQQFFYLVGEPYHGGDLQELKLKARQQGTQMTENWWKSIWIQCLEGLKFMHEQAMLHCDIKEPNIMIKSSNFTKPDVVFIDFGVSKAMADSLSDDTGGTPGYLPPETIRTGKWFPRGDIFSMGVTIMQVLCDKIPPTGPRTTSTPGGIFVEGCATLDDINNATLTRNPPFHLLPPEARGMQHVLQGMLLKDMKSRPTAPNVMKDVWFVTAPREPGLPAVSAKNKFATVGITKSFLAQMDDDDEDVPEHISALKEVRQLVGR